MLISYEKFLKEKIGYENVRELIVLTGDIGTTDIVICTGEGTTMDQVDKALQVGYRRNAKSIMIMAPNTQAKYCVYISKQMFEALGGKLKKQMDAVKEYEDRYLEGYNRIQEYLANRILQQSM